MKKLGVAAVLALSAASAFASNFRGADQVYVPVAGHLASGAGTYVSDVFVANLSGDSVDVSVLYIPNGQGQSALVEKHNAFTLRPYERKEFPDFFLSGMNLSSGYGQLILNGCKTGTSCGPETQDQYGYSPNYRDISAESRIYLIPTGQEANPKTVGQDISGIPWYSFVSSLQSNVGLDKVFITGVRQGTANGQVGSYRTNIGLVNASQYSTTTFKVTAYQGTLTQADKKGEYVLQNVPPLFNQQISFATMFPSLTGWNYFVTIEQTNSIPTGDSPDTCTSGCPAFLAYGSLSDNNGSDPTTLESQYLLPLSSDAIDVIYPSGAGKSPIRRSVSH